MPESHPVLYSFNRGIVSSLGLARTDLKRIALSAEIQDNFMPRSLGSMSIRPGWQMIGQPYLNQRAVYHPFVFSTDPDAVGGMALMEFTSGYLRFWQDDEVVARVAVSATVSNGTFAGDLTGWTDGDAGGAVSQWVAGNLMELTGDGVNAALRYQSISIAGGDVGKVHALRILISMNGVPVKCRIGSTAGAEDLFHESTLGPGWHSIAFTPAGAAAVVEFYNERTSPGYVQSVAVEAAGDLVLPTPYNSDGLCKLIRIDQSADVVYIAANGVAQYKIEKRQLSTDGSWSIVRYLPEDGPFLVINTTPATLTPGELSGATSLTASVAGFFHQEHVGALFRLASNGQKVTRAIAAQNVFSNPVKVTNVGDARNLLIVITGTWSATVTLQQSIDSSDGPWTDVSGKTWTANTSETYNDKLDNQVIYYRIGVKTGDYTSGTVNVELDFQTGSINGICRVVSVASDTVASVVTLTDFGSTDATTDWYEGQWSNFRGYPTAVVIDDGRVTWLGRGQYVGSVSDAYESFDDTLTGDSRPINRTIGSGPLDIINSAVSLLQVIMFAQASEWSARSDALTSAMTASNINFKDFSNQGSASVAALKVDRDAIFVQRSGCRVFAVELDNIYLGIYKSTDLTLLIPDLGVRRGQYSRLALQRTPDTRIHVLTGDGGVMVLVYDPAEDLKCWVSIGASALRPNDTVEDIVTLPGQIETQVYYQTNRLINGVQTRFLEKWAREDQCGADQNAPRLADCFVTGSGAISGLDHLNGETVVIFGDGQDRGTAVVASGAVSGSYTNWVVGLPYEAKFKSAKLAYGAQLGSAINQMKLVKRIGFVLTNTHRQGLQYGPDFDSLDYMPPVEDGKAIELTSYWDEYDNDQMGFDGKWRTDARLCLRAAAPRGVTIEGVTLNMETNE